MGKFVCLVVLIAVFQYFYIEGNLRKMEIKCAVRTIEIITFHAINSKWSFGNRLFSIVNLYRVCDSKRWL